jgi:hypothetical protein
VNFAKGSLTSRDITATIALATTVRNSGFGNAMRRSDAPDSGESGATFDGGRTNAPAGERVVSRQGTPVPPYCDVYVLSPERSATAAERFLDTFAPKREQSAEEYVFPQFAEQPLRALKSAREAIQYCEIHSGEAQSLYFRNLGAGPAHAMLFFTSDGGLILGVSVVDQENEWITRLKEYVGTEFGYIAFESPPAATAAEFRELAASVG